MKFSFKTLVFFILIIILVPLAWYFGYRYSLFDKKTTIKEEVLLERVQHVVKLGTVEGIFSEIFNYSDYYSYNIGPLRKKALIRIRAKVLVGYDLDSIDIKVNYLSKKIVVSPLPKADILSIDHEMDYYDITEGYFNSFTKEDHNMLQIQSKEFIRKKALESSLFETADVQLRKNLEMLDWVLRDLGWEIEIKEAPKKRFWD